MKAQQQQRCMEILEYLASEHPQKYMYFAGPAAAALDPAMQADYMEIIAEPRDFGMIKGKLEAGEYLSIAAFQDDVTLCLNNAKVFCKPRFPDVARVADNLQKIFKNQMEKALKQGFAATPGADAIAPTNAKQVQKGSKAPAAATPAEAVSHTSASMDDGDDTASSSSLSMRATKSTSALPGFRSKCEQIIKNLGGMTSVKLLFTPVDTAVLPVYPLVVPDPMDFSTIRAKLSERGNAHVTKYEHHNEFALDMRRVFANFLRYNCTEHDIRLRSDIRHILMRFEKLWYDLQADSEHNPITKGFFFTQPFPALQGCLDALEDVLKLDSVLSYHYPITYWFAGDDLDEYLDKVAQPMDIATIVTSIVEAQYSTLIDIERDFNLMISNIETYYGGLGKNKEKVDLMKGARFVKETFSKGLMRYNKHSNQMPVLGSGGLAATTSAKSGGASVKAQGGIGASVVGSGRGAQVVDEPFAAVQMGRGEGPSKRPVRETSSSSTHVAELTDVAPKNPGPLPGYAPKCHAIINALGNMVGVKFLKEPVDFSVLPQYPLCIPHPMDFKTIHSNLDSKYKTHNEFALDMRRVFGNFMRFNFTKNERAMRSSIKDILLRFEKLWYELQLECENDPKMRNHYFSTPLPQLQMCLSAFEEVYKEEGAANFVYPMDYWLAHDPATLANYKKVVTKPMYMGTIVSKAIEGEYTCIADIENDFDLMISNVERYYGQLNVDDKVLYGGQAVQLKEAFKRVVAKGVNANNLMWSLSATQGEGADYFSAPAASAAVTTAPARARVQAQPTYTSAKAQARKSSAAIEQEREAIAPAWLRSRLQVSWPTSGPPDRRVAMYLKEMFKNCLAECKKHYMYSGMVSTMRIVTAQPFLRAVDPSRYPDYYQIIKTPMDMHQVEKKISGDKYNNVFEILADIDLIRTNAHRYNAGEMGLEIRIMADSLYNYFKYLTKVSLLDMRITLRDNKLVSEFLFVPEVVESIMESEDPKDVKTAVETFTKDIAAEEMKAEEDARKAAEAKAAAVLRQAQAQAQAQARPQYIEEVPQQPGSAQKRYKEDEPTVEEWDEDDGDDIEEEAYEDDGNAGGDDEDEEFADEDYDSDSPKKKKRAKKAAKPAQSRKSTSYKETYDDYDEFEDDYVDYDSDSPKKKRVKKAPKPVYVPEPVYEEVYPEYEELPQWQMAIPNVLKAITKHPYVDRNKPASVLGDFYVSIQNAYILSEKEQQEASVSDMNLSILIDSYNAGYYTSPEAFTRDLLSIFQKVVDHFVPFKETPAGKRMYKKCLHLISYCKWLCLENLVKDDFDESAFPEQEAEPSIEDKPLELGTEVAESDGAAEDPAQVQQQAPSEGDESATGNSSGGKGPDQATESSEPMQISTTSAAATEPHAEVSEPIGEDSGGAENADVAARSEPQEVTANHEKTEVVVTTDDTMSGEANAEVDKPKARPLPKVLSLDFRSTARAAREEIMANAFMESCSVCKGVLKKLKHCKNKQEITRLSYFTQELDPRLCPPDYNMYVRRPMDLGTIEYRLEATFQNATKVVKEPYRGYGEYIENLRRVFTNAIKYNSKHVESDDTGVSAMLYEAAMDYQVRLEGLLGMFTIEIAEKLERNRIEVEVDGIMDELAQQREEERKLQEFKQAQLEKLKAEDEVFARDHDIEAKKEETRQRMKEIAFKKRFGMEQMDEGDDAYDGEFDTMDESEIAQLQPLLDAQMTAEMLLVHRRFRHLIQAKIKARTKAWELWMPHAVVSKAKRGADAAQVETETTSASDGQVFKVEGNTTVPGARQTEKASAELTQGNGAAEMMNVDSACSQGGDSDAVISAKSFQAFTMQKRNTDKRAKRDTSTLRMNAKIPSVFGL